MGRRMTDVTYELTARDVYDIQCLEQKLRSYQAKINAAQSATYASDDVVKHFPHGRVGGSGKPVRALNKRREQDIERFFRHRRTIDTLTPHIQSIESRIATIRSGERARKEALAAQRKQEREAKRAARADKPKPVPYWHDPGWIERYTAWSDAVYDYCELQRPGLSPTATFHERAQWEGVVSPWICLQAEMAGAHLRPEPCTRALFLSALESDSQNLCVVVVIPDRGKNMTQQHKHRRMTQISQVSSFKRSLLCDYDTIEAADLVYPPCADNTQAAQFLYLFRRFGYPKYGSDPHKDIAVYWLTTPDPHIIMSCCPRASIHWSFGYAVSPLLRTYLNETRNDIQPRVHRACCAAMRELLRPVFIRDAPYNILGFVPPDSVWLRWKHAVRSTQAGYGVGDFDPAQAAQQS